MSTTSFTTISWKTLYDQAIAKEPVEKERAYMFSGRTFTQDEPTYAWVEAQRPAYTLPYVLKEDGDDYRTL